MSPENYENHSKYAENQGVNTYNLGVSDFNGRSRFWQSTHVNGINAQSTLFEPAKQYTDNYSHIVKHEISSVDVDITRLEDFCSSNNIYDIDILHEDTDGSLYQVLIGMGKLRPKMIFGEFLLDSGWIGAKHFIDTIELLKSMSYLCVAEFAFDKLFIHQR